MSDASPDTQIPLVSYLCLEQSREGSAAFAHLQGYFDGWPAGSLIVTRAMHDSEDPLWGKVVSILSAFLRFARTLSAARVVGARAHPLVFACILMGKITGKRTFLFLPGHPGDLPKRTLTYRVVGCVAAASFKGAIRMSDSVFATSSGLAEWARTQTSAPVVQVTNGVDIGRFSWPVEGRTGAVFVGTPAPWQGLDTLLAAANAPEWPPGLELTIIGVPPTEPEDLTVGNIKFLGRLSPTAVAEELSRNAIGVSPKLLDQSTLMGISPFKLAEYHGAGLAVIASDVPGQREMLTLSHGGALVEPGSPQAIVDVMVKWMSEPVVLRQMQIQARSYAERELSWESQRKRVMHALGVL